MIILCDIDNCISDDTWRYPLINWVAPQGRERYHNYHRAASCDAAANLHVLRVPDAKVYFLTGMPEAYAEIRVRWLLRHEVRFAGITFRANQCIENSVELKRLMLRGLRAAGVPLEDCVAAYDDRRAVVQMYCEEGLPGVHLQIQEQEHMQRVV